MNDEYDEEDNQPIEFYMVDEARDTPIEIVEAYFSESELDYIKQSIEDILRAYDYFGWDYAPSEEDLYRYLAGNAYYIRSDENVEHCACWRVQIQPMEHSEHGFEILLIFGE